MAVFAQPVFVQRLSGVWPAGRHVTSTVHWSYARQWHVPQAIFFSKKLKFATVTKSPPPKRLGMGIHFNVSFHLSGVFLLGRWFHEWWNWKHHKCTISFFTSSESDACTRATGCTLQIWWQGTAESCTCSQASGTAVTALGSRCSGPLLNTVNCHSHLGVLCCNTGLPGMSGLFNFAVCLTWWRWLTLFCMFWLSQVVLLNTFRHTRVCLFRISAFPPCVHDLNERLGRPASFYLLCCGLSLSNSIVCCGVGVDCSIVLLFFLMGGGGGDAHWTILFSITPNVICLLRRSTPLLISTLFLSLY